MRQVRVEIECRNSRQPASRVEISHCGERCYLAGTGNDGRPKTPPVLHRNAEPLHESAGVCSESLLPRNQGIAVMRVFLVTLLQVSGGADIVMWPDDQARALPFQKIANGFDLVGAGHLFRCHVIETEDQQGVGVRQHLVI